jgi:hypothetical protein
MSNDQDASKIFTIGAITVERIAPRPQLGSFVELQESLEGLQDLLSRARNRGFARGAPAVETSANQPGFLALFSLADRGSKAALTEALAYELGRDLYRVDVSKVISKFIGETEKNLREVFLAAGASGAVLFFDEADALFGKRTEVKDAHDRYVDVETGLILGHSKSFAGPVIFSACEDRPFDTDIVSMIDFVIRVPPLGGFAQR